LLSYVLDKFKFPQKTAATTTTRMQGIKVNFPADAPAISFDRYRDKSIQPVRKAMVTIISP